MPMPDLQLQKMLAQLAQQQAPQIQIDPAQQQAFVAGVQKAMQEKQAALNQLLNGGNPQDQALQALQYPAELARQAMQPYYIPSAPSPAAALAMGPEYTAQAIKRTQVPLDFTAGTTGASGISPESPRYTAGVKKASDLWKEDVKKAIALSNVDALGTLENALLQQQLQSMNQQYAIELENQKRQAEWMDMLTKLGISAAERQDAITSQSYLKQLDLANMQQAHKMEMAEIAAREAAQRRLADLSYKHNEALKFGIKLQNEDGSIGYFNPDQGYVSWINPATGEYSYTELAMPISKISEKSAEGRPVDGLFTIDSHGNGYLVDPKTLEMKTVTPGDIYPETVGFSEESQMLSQLLMTSIPEAVKYFKNMFMSRKDFGNVVAQDMKVAISKNLRGRSDIMAILSEIQKYNSLSALKDEDRKVLQLLYSIVDSIRRDYDNRMKYYTSLVTPQPAQNPQAIQPRFAGNVFDKGQPAEQTVESQVNQQISGARSVQPVLDVTAPPGYEGPVQNAVSVITELMRKSEEERRKGALMPYSGPTPYGL